MNNIKVTNKRGLTGVLADSLKALKQNPVIFAPKLASTFIGAIWFVAILDISKKSKLSLELGAVFLASTVVLLFIGLLASVLVSAMVDLRDNYSGLKLLKEGLYESKDSILSIALTVGAVVLGMIFSYIFIFAGIIGYYMTGSLLVLVLSVSIGFLIVLAMGFYLYFIPISLFEKESFREALSDSSGFSSENSWDVSLLMVFSLVLLAPALYFTGRLETLGYIGFVLSRMVSGIVNTYVFTLSPEYYLSAQSSD